MAMFWADRLVDDIRTRFDSLVRVGEKIIIRDEKTASGRVHVGSMRGVAIHGLIDEILTEARIPHEFLYEINDIDPMDDIPSYLDERAYARYLGLPLYVVPSPDSVAKNYAEYFGGEFEKVITETGFQPKFYRAHELYESGKMDALIRVALEKKDLIREIYQRVSGSVKDKQWLPIGLIKEGLCPEGQVPRAIGFDGEKVSYVCMPWGEKEIPSHATEVGSISPLKGNAKFTWKVDWAAKWKAVGVHVEGGGKDHSTKGGARDVANTISKEVFGYEPPFDIPYEFFLVGGKKMSSSKGRGSSAREIADLVPPTIFRLAHLGKDPMQAFNFDPSGDTIPVLYDLYDKLAEGYWSGGSDAYARLFVLIHPPEEREVLRQRFLPRFSQVAFLVQMPHLDMLAEVALLKGSALTKDDVVELESRAHYARGWLELYAPEKFRFELKQDSLPEAAQSLSLKQKEALRAIAQYIKDTPELSGENLHKRLHELKDELSIQPQELFSAIYLTFLGKTFGPKAGWFLSVLDRSFLLSRLEEASA